MFVIRNPTAEPEGMGVAHYRPPSWIDLNRQRVRVRARFSDASRWALRSQSLTMSSNHGREGCPRRRSKDD